MMLKPSLSAVGMLLCVVGSPSQAADLREPPLPRSGLPEVPPAEVITAVPIAPVPVAPFSVLPPPVTCGFLSPCAPPYVLAPDGFYFVQVRPPQFNPMDFHDERTDYNQ